ncbi:hypothetical protein NUU61_009278 [Penicillium alfredii]|uniref:HECT-type E3 ubiquitin transferase n=1 Tax=Penicillium alfredii TaxID=1506179 RepID=A0A9W9EN17_9EURO|nr:uncharacterized protein NUU61_009278 [Penicillium alfredii]KAJ5084699.1 hypothetical protein NUU61_009278 [Penicillium alfredii]
MFHSFTGDARRPRQVNLRGRTTNPFAAFPSNSPSRQTPHATNPQSAVAIAQQERALRQEERDRQAASRLIQRVWRGYHNRKGTYQIFRLEWDVNERIREERAMKNGPETSPTRPDHISHRLQPPAPYATAEQCLSQLRLLVQFVGHSRQSDDAFRLVYFSDAFVQTFHSLPTIATEGEWTELLKRFAAAILQILGPRREQLLWEVPSTVTPLLEMAVFLTRLIPKKMAAIGHLYYTTMASLTLRLTHTFHSIELTSGKMVEAVISLLKPITSETLSAYEAFATSYLSVPDLQMYLGSLDELSRQINYKMLASAVGSCLASTGGSSRTLDDTETRLWVLSYLVFFHRYALGAQENSQAPELEFVAVVSELLTSMASHITSRLMVEDTSSEDKPLPPFIKDQIMSLANQNSVTGLLSRIRSSNVSQADLANTNSGASKETKILATYALNLLRVFPRRGDEIRMWLYLGSAPSEGPLAGRSDARIPAIKYFWQASRSSQVFESIKNDPDSVLSLLQPQMDMALPIQIPFSERNQQWTIILLFLELYTFVLKVMDDEEFFSQAASFTASETQHISWTKESALPLQDVKELSLFLKNLAFTLYWNSADLVPEEASQQNLVDIGSYFNRTSQRLPKSPMPPDGDQRSQNGDLPGVTGIPLEYFKGIVTGLLRMIYERDSRRRFLPHDHWLTTRFDIEHFTQAVVEEEERRREFQDEGEDATDPDLMDEDAFEPFGLAGTSHAQWAMRNEASSLRQLQNSRRRLLGHVIPRLEILRNVPFFVPFTTRVQIFREFIIRDQKYRRNGYVDSDMWRMFVAQTTGQHLHGQPSGQDILARHHADIRRGSVFDDAFSQFYTLGDGLKEPIQISFIDQFGNMEAGIDGGGVTKEFLTSVISEAFKTDDKSSMFVENDHHLLYPNPVAVEHLKKTLHESRSPESSVYWTAEIRALLRRYEFLGRVIGKCLYEGILVDVHFAPFFLLKWALTGGSGSAVRESSYRANVNDLRDLDEGLYQGLLQLKNYPGNVEDFALDFTVTDTIPTDGSTKHTVTKELKPHGSSTAVTNQNRLVYISCVARYRLQLQPSLQTNAFLQGLGQIIQPSWLSMFNQSELQTLVSGETGEIDVEDLRRNTLYGGVYTIGDDHQEHPTIRLFWEVMHSMNNEDRQKVLRFVTSTPRAPLLGFSHLNPRFSIRDSSEDQERLPSTSTCVNLLKLPRYTSADMLRTKLLYAVSSGAGFDLS